MIEVLQPPEAAPVAVAELRAFLRIEGSQHDPELATHLRVATETCERFLGTPLLPRRLRERLQAATRWQPLGEASVRSIDAVHSVAGDGTMRAMRIEAWAIDIDSRGGGWVRLTGPDDAQVIAVDYVAGSAGDWNAVPETLRHGILRLAAHLHVDADGVPPAAIAALWRPWRTMRLRAERRP